MPYLRIPLDKTTYISGFLKFLGRMIDMYFTSFLNVTTVRNTMFSVKSLNINNVWKGGV